jgi:SIR2-like domain
MGVDGLVDFGHLADGFVQGNDGRGRRGTIWQGGFFDSPGCWSRLIFDKIALQGRVTAPRAGATHRDVRRGDGVMGMALAPEQFQMPNELRDLVLSKKCVAFIGSGPSTGCYDSWPELVNALCKLCGSRSRVNRDSHPDAFLDAAQDAKDTNEGAYYNYLGQHFGRPANHASLTYDALLALPFRCYLTVNLDPLLALKCRNARIGCDTNIKVYPALDRMAMANRSIHYLHGYISEGTTPPRGSIVLSRKEFKAAYGANSSLMNLLVPTFEYDAVVFVGCRLKEPVMSSVFAICKQHQQARLKIMMEHGHCTTDVPRRFILVPQPEVRGSDGEPNAELGTKIISEEAAHYNGLDIKPVWYPAPGGDHSALRYALETLAELPAITTNLGWEGGVYAP